MNKSDTWLLDYKKNVYSQAGEDGIIEKILDLLPNKNNWCVEFGAWDGKHYSNTKNLIDSGASAVLIEGSEERFKDLLKTYNNNQNIHMVNDFVGFSSNKNLDSILKSSPIPNDFDLLSIDVDGNDYHIWKAVNTYNPKLICIEFNPSIPTEIDFSQKADQKINQGSSLLALTKLGKEKGYELISVLPFNAFFIKKEYFPLFNITDNSPQNLRKSLDFITHVFVGYDGKVFLRGNNKLTWHGVEIQASKLQQLPRILRKFPGNYSKIESVLFTIYKKLFT